MITFLLVVAIVLAVFNTYALCHLVVQVDAIGKAMEGHQELYGIRDAELLRAAREARKGVAA